MTRKTFAQPLIEEDLGLVPVKVEQVQNMNTSKDFVMITLPIYE